MIMARSFALQSPYHPTTFLERGAAVPFTTPLLAGARVRAAQRSGLELVLPNPGGGKGFYVLPWTGVQEFCALTLHDRQLQDRAAGLQSVTPSGIRQAAREIAANGYAGREARDAATRAQRQATDDQLATNYYLLLILVSQVEQSALANMQERLPQLEMRAKRAVASIAPELGLEPDFVSTLLEELAVLLQGIGVGPIAAKALLPRALGNLVALRRDLEQWTTSHNDDTSELADIIGVTADLSIGCAGKAIADVRSSTEKMSVLLSRWRTEPQALSSWVARPEWLLDGWEPICLLWSEASTVATRRAALREMIDLVPILPKEVGDWIGMAEQIEAVNVYKRFSTLNRDWRSGLPVLDLVEEGASQACALDRVARNERLRALAA
ncbi:MAG: hypothetical protein NVSMB18_20330 [Acetobacteraceae bacterium]